MSEGRRGVLRSVALTAVLLAAACDEVGSRFDTREEAEPVIDKGWLPPAMPASATGIRERHDLDVNIGEGRFDFDAVDAAKIRASVTPISRPPSRCPIPWSGMKAEGREWFQQDDFYLAVDWRRSDVKFWLCHRSRGSL